MNILLLRVHSIRNAGDHAILRATLRLVEQAFPGARVTIAAQDPQSARTVYGSEAVVGGMLGWVTRLEPNGRRRLYRGRWVGYTLLVLLSALFSRLLQRPIILLRDPDKRRLLHAYMAADLVLASGGGYLYSTRKYSRWFVALMLELALAIWLGKPLVLLPQSIGPLSGPEQRWLVRWLIRRARLVLIREDISLQLLQSIGARGPVLPFADLAFSQLSGSPAEAQAWLASHGCPCDPARPLLGLTVLNWAAQYQSFERQADYELAMTRLCDALIERGFELLHLPQCIGPTQDEDDRLIALRIRERLQQPACLHVPLDQPAPEVLQAVCEQLALMVGTRMHSVIFALNAGVAPLVIGYLHKSRGMLSWLDWQDWCVDITEVADRELCGQVLRLYEQRKALLPGLQQRVARQRRIAASLPGLLRAVSGPRPAREWPSQ